MYMYINIYLYMRVHTRERWVRTEAPFPKLCTVAVTDAGSPSLRGEEPGKAFRPVFMRHPVYAFEPGRPNKNSPCNQRSAMFQLHNVTAHVSANANVLSRRDEQGRLLWMDDYCGAIDEVEQSLHPVSFPAFWCM